jgi:predicted membrane channel-forming protein YqfA (hemolysin III family)
MLTRLTHAQQRREIGCGAVLGVAVAAPGFFIFYQALVRGDAGAWKFAVFWLAAGLLFFLASVYHARRSSSRR